VRDGGGDEGSLAAPRTRPLGVCVRRSGHSRGARPPARATKQTVPPNKQCDAMEDGAHHSHHKICTTATRQGSMIASPAERLLFSTERGVVPILDGTHTTSQRRFRRGRTIERDAGDRTE
jgi:hypothetical protein